MFEKNKNKQKRGRVGPFKKFKGSKSENVAGDNFDPFFVVNSKEWKEAATAAALHKTVIASGRSFQRLFDAQKSL